MNEDFLFHACRFRERCNRLCYEKTHLRGEQEIIDEQRLDGVMDYCSLFVDPKRKPVGNQWHLENLLAKYGLQAIECCDHFGEQGLKVANRWVHGYIARDRSIKTQVNGSNS